MTEAIRVGMLGCGTVGTGVIKILSRNLPEIENRIGMPVDLVRVAVKNPGKRRQTEIPAQIITGNADEIISDPDIDIVIEVIGGLDPAFEYIRAAVDNGKYVVTANKEVLAKFGKSLQTLAADRGVDLYYEAAVAGGIPIIKTVKESLAANRISEMIGIINGTTNYMLTEMTEKGTSFDDALRQAQEQGFAEQDPSSDIEGDDAAYKLAILASLAFEADINIDDVYREGITGIHQEDIQAAAELGYVTKLLAIAKYTGGQVEVRVHPAFIPIHHPLASVQHVFNAIFVRGDAVGELMLYGRGAGEMPTASAVVADLIDAARDLRNRVNGRVKSTTKSRPVSSISGIVTKYYVRMQVVDKPGVLAAIARAFGREDVSIESVIQKGRGEDPVSLVFVTHEVKEENIRSALRSIRTLNVVRDITNVIRVEDSI